MPVDRGEFIEIPKEELVGIYPFFGDKTLLVDSLQAEKTPEGAVGWKGIGLWIVRDDLTEQHFNDFQTRGQTVEGLELLPGHYWAEVLGQTLGALTYLRYSEYFTDVLPTFDKAFSSYKEAAFPKDRVNLCVEIIEEPEIERGRLRVIKGRGAAVFSERTLGVVDPIIVNIHPLPVGVRGLNSLRERHRQEMEQWVPASFANFGKYFSQNG